MFMDTILANWFYYVFKMLDKTIGTTLSIYLVVIFFFILFKKWHVIKRLPITFHIFPLMILNIFITAIYVYTLPTKTLSTAKNSLHQTLRVFEGNGLTTLDSIELFVLYTLTLIVAFFIIVKIAEYRTRMNLKDMAYNMGGNPKWLLQVIEIGNMIDVPNLDFPVYVWQLFYGGIDEEDFVAVLNTVTDNPDLSSRIIVRREQARKLFATHGIKREKVHDILITLGERAYKSGNRDLWATYAHKKSRWHEDAN